MDTETNRTDNYRDRYCLGVSVATDLGSYYIPVGHKEWLGNVPNNLHIPSDFLLDYGGPLPMHGVKFDVQVLERAGIKVPYDNLWCTINMHHFIDENVKYPEGGHSLDKLSIRYLGKRKDVELSKAMVPNWERVPPYIMARYAETDAVNTRELFPILEAHMESAWIDQWVNYDREFCLLLKDMEALGLPIDRDLCANSEALCLLRMKEIRKELGFDPAKPSQLHPKLFSDPPDGLGLNCPSYTPGGKPQVTGEWLQTVGHPVTALVYEYRKLGKQVSSYFSAYLKLTTSDYARLHANFKQHGTVTGRLSCEIPNLEQLPRKDYGGSSVKKLFENEPGKQLWEIDFRTLEFRLIAVYSKCQVLLDMFKAEGDLHQTVADAVGVDRHTAKNRINYPIGFGAGGQRIATELGKSIEEGFDIYNKFKGEYPEIFYKMDDAKQHCYDTEGEIAMWNGRKRHFMFQSEYRKAFNNIIQGGGFEIVKRAMLEARKAGATMMSNQVHDSVWINVDNEKEVEEIQHVMEDWTTEVFGLTFRTDRKLLKK